VSGGLFESVNDYDTWGCMAIVSDIRWCAGRKRLGTAAVELFSPEWCNWRLFYSFRGLLLDVFETSVDVFRQVQGCNISFLYFQGGTIRRFWWV